MVDLIFLQNIRLLIEKEIFETYELTIYMIKQDKFIIYMKKVNFTIQLIKYIMMKVKILYLKNIKILKICNYLKLNNS